MSPPELPLALGQHSVQKSLSAEGGHGAGCSGATLQPMFRGQDHQRKMWSQTRLLKPSAVPPASHFRAATSSLPVAEAEQPGMPNGHRKAPGTPGCSPKGREKILKA